MESVSCDRELMYSLPSNYGIATFNVISGRLHMITGLGKVSNERYL